MGDVVLVALIVVIHNDATGDDEHSNYDVSVRVTITPTRLKTIWSGRVEGHRRGDGWPALLRQLAEVADGSA